MPVRETILRVFTEVAHEQNRKFTPPTDATELLDLGLDSLCMAVIIARLEDEFGTDPFSSGEEVESPVTFGDFVALYNHAVAA